MTTIVQQETRQRLLHALLIMRQSEHELQRKALKACGRSTWSQEELDYADRWAERMSGWMGDGSPQA